MKAILSEKAFLTSNITTSHIVVGISHGIPYVLSNNHDGYIFLPFISSIPAKPYMMITTGEGILYSMTDLGDFPHSKGSIKEAVDNFMSDGDIAFFKQNDWKEAMKWLIDNAE